MRIENIEESEFNKFAGKNKYRNYYQTSSYGGVFKNFNYNVRYIGIKDDNDKLIGASLLLLQDGAMKTKLAYAPRGILFDYTDSSKVVELVDTMKKTLGKEGIVSLRIDPAIPLSIRDKDGNVININNEASIIMENLKNAGFNYEGETLYFETEKPRWEAITVLEKDIREIYKDIDKRTRNKINKALKSGIEVYRDNEKDVTTLYSFIKENGYPKKFYSGLLRNFKDNSDVFYAKLNTEKFVINSKEIYENELEKNEQLSYEFQSMAQQNLSNNEMYTKKQNSDKLLNIYKSNLIFATNLLKEHPEGIIIAGAISIIYDNAAYLIIEGTNKKYRNLNANYLLKWEMIRKYNDEKFKYFNLNAVTGNFDKTNKFAGLNEMKTSYNAVITEYIGEYDIILNNFKYNLYKNFSKK